jgi:hypothetical protein
MAEDSSPPEDQLVDGVRAHEHMGRTAQLRRADQDRAILPTAESPMTADESLERVHLTRARIAGADDVQIGRLGLLGGNDQSFAGTLAVLQQRVDSSTEPERRSTTPSLPTAIGPWNVIATTAPIAGRAIKPGTRAGQRRSISSRSRRAVSRT